MCQRARSDSAESIVCYSTLLRCACVRQETADPRSTSGGVEHSRRRRCSSLRACCCLDVYKPTSAAIPVPALSYRRECTSRWAAAHRMSATAVSAHQGQRGVTQICPERPLLLQIQYKRFVVASAAIATCIADSSSSSSSNPGGRGMHSVSGAQSAPTDMTTLAATTTAGGRIDRAGPAGTNRLLSDLVTRLRILVYFHG